MVLQGGNEVDGFALVLIHDLCIDLRGAHIGVSKELGNGVEVGAVGEGERRKCVACDVEGDVLGNPGFLPAFFVRV